MHTPFHTGAHRLRTAKKVLTERFWKAGSGSEPAAWYVETPWERERGQDRKRGWFGKRLHALKTHLEENRIDRILTEARRAVEQQNAAILEKALNHGGRTTAWYWDMRFRGSVLTSSW